LLTFIVAYFFYRQRNGVAVFLLLGCLFWTLFLFTFVPLDPLTVAFIASVMAVMPMFFVDRASLSEIVLGYLDQVASLRYGNK
jgi:hypothetical protein